MSNVVAPWVLKSPVGHLIGEGVAASDAEAVAAARAALARDAYWAPRCSGATSFPDGNPPLIGELKVNGGDAVAIVDAEGLSVFWGDECEFSASTRDLPAVIALRTALLLPAETTTLGLKALDIDIEHGEEDTDDDTVYPGDEAVS